MIRTKLEISDFISNIENGKTFKGCLEYGSHVEFELCYYLTRPVLIIRKNFTKTKQTKILKDFMNIYNVFADSVYVYSYEKFEYEK